VPSFLPTPGSAFPAATGSVFTVPPAAPAAPAAGLAQTALLSAAPPPSIVYQGDAVKNIIERWKQDLADNLTKFHAQAQNVRQWEVQLHSNRKTINKIVGEINSLQTNQKELENFLGKIDEYQVSFSSLFFFAPMRIHACQ